MIRILPLALLFACNPSEVDTVEDTNEDTDEVECTVIETRTYDTGELGNADPTLGFSVDDVSAGLLGNFAGSLRTSTGNIGVDVTMSIDGVTEVTVYDNCDTQMRVPLVLAISTENTGDGYLVDDLWSPVLELSSLDAGFFHDEKPPEDFDGTATATADLSTYTNVMVDVTGTFDEGGWEGEISWTGEMDDGEVASAGVIEALGSYTVTPE